MKAAAAAYAVFDGCLPANKNAASAAGSGSCDIYMVDNKPGKQQAQGASAKQHCKSAAATPLAAGQSHRTPVRSSCMGQAPT